MNSDAMKVLSTLVGSALIAACASPVVPPHDGSSVTLDAHAVDGASGDRVEPDASGCIGGPQPADGPCRCQSDCAPNAVCAPEAESRAARGRCLTGCSTSAPAPEGFVCFSSAGRVGLFARCGTSARCREGWACTQEGAPAHCTPFCFDDAQCESGVCDRDTGQCVSRRAPVVGAEVGAACARNEDCRGRACLPGSAGFTGGYCSGRCLFGAGPCLGDGYCFVPPRDRAMGLEIGLCLKTCAGGDDCRAGYTCTPYDGTRVCFL